MDSIYSDTICEIVSFLRAREVLDCRLICKQFRIIIDTRHIIWNLRFPHCTLKLVYKFAKHLEELKEFGGIAPTQVKTLSEAKRKIEEWTLQTK